VNKTTSNITYKIDRKKVISLLDIFLFTSLTVLLTQHTT